MENKVKVENTGKFNETEIYVISFVSEQCEACPFKGTVHCMDFPNC